MIVDFEICVYVFGFVFVERIESGVSFFEGLFVVGRLEDLFVVVFSD